MLCASMRLVGHSETAGSGYLSLEDYSREAWDRVIPDNNGRNGLRHDREVASGGKHSPQATLVLVEKPVVKHGSGAAYNCVMTFAVGGRSRLGVCIIRHPGPPGAA